jgi:hypothetical protein
MMLQEILQRSRHIASLGAAIAELAGDVLSDIDA